MIMTSGNAQYKDMKMMADEIMSAIEAKSFEIKKTVPLISNMRAKNVTKLSGTS